MTRGGHASRRALLLAFGPVLLIALLCGALVLGTSHSPTRLSLDLSWAGPSTARPFGSGEAGIDVLGVVSHATLRALALATGVSLLGFLVGTPLGTTAALRGGVLERWTLRAADLVQSFPTFLLALAVLSAVRTPSRLHIGLVFSVGAWAPFARLALVQARGIADAPFVEAARALGATETRVVLGETALGFVGLGPGDGVSLGALLEQGTAGMVRAPHVLIVGALAVMAVSGSLQVASEGVRRFATRRG